MSQTFEEKLEEINNILEEQIKIFGEMEKPKTSQNLGDEIERLKKNANKLIHIATGQKVARVWRR